MVVRERVEVVDVLRGFALLGILYAHMVVWHTGGALPSFVYDRYQDTASLMAMAVFGTFVFGKFFSLFAFLFGLSFHIMRGKKSRHEFKSWFSVRMLVLGLIGFLHHVLWRGDILLIYSLLGFALLMLYNLPTRSLLIIGVLLVFNIPNLIYDVLFPDPTAQVNLPMHEEAHRYYTLLTAGSFLEIIRDNITIVASKFGFQFSSGRLFTTLGFFLLGTWFGKINGMKLILGHQIILNRIFRLTGLACLVMLAIGFGFVLSGALTLPDLKFNPSIGWLLSWMYNCFNALLTFWYIAAIAFLFTLKKGRRIVAPLAYAGRMAMSGYIFQTLVGLMIYYPFALGLFHELAPWMNALLVIPVFAIQIQLSKWWLSRYSKGPLEYIWAQTTDSLRVNINRVKHSF